MQSSVGAGLRRMIGGMRSVLRQRRYREGSTYWRHAPHARQSLALSTDQLEVFYGGAAGGGKSDWLLMEALKYVHIPGYAALILRKNYTLLQKAGAIMDRAITWLKHTDAKWNGTQKRFTFPSGAVIDFGFIERPIDWMNYQGTEYHCICWDELSEFQLSEDDENNPYLCLFRSLRAPPPGVPLRIRSASNPGNVGHKFVKNRFIPQTINWTAPNVIDSDICFVPSKVDDNPSNDPEEYKKKLAKLPPVTRKRLLDGDWDIMEGLIIDPGNLRYVKLDQHGNYVLLDQDGKDFHCFHAGQCIRFATIDTAGTAKDKAEEKRGKTASWSVCTVFDYHQPTDSLIVVDLWRRRVDWPGLKNGIPEFLRKNKVQTVLIENAHFGQVLETELTAFSTSLIGPVIPGMSEGYQGAKLDRAVAAGLLVRIEENRLYFLLSPESGEWNQNLLAELTLWSGHPDEQADQIDTLSYGSYQAGSNSGASWGGTVQGKGFKRSG